MTPPLYGSEQRINGTFVTGDLLLIPIEYNFGQCCSIPQRCWHAFPNFNFTWPQHIDLTSIKYINVIGGYTIHGSVGKYTDGDGYIWLSKISQDIGSNYVFMSPQGMDDILWIKNLGTGIGTEWYCGYGWNASIRQCVMNCYPFITDHFNLAVDGPREVTLELHCSDYWGYAIGGYIGYLLVEFKSNQDDWYSFNQDVEWAAVNYKRFGFTGPQV